MSVPGLGETMLQVQRWDAVRDGVLTASRLRQRFEAQGLWVTECRLPPGTTHRSAPAGHDVLQVVLTGLLKITITNDSESTILGAGDALFVPRGSACLVEVVGSTPVVAYAAAFLPHGPQPGRASRPELLESIRR